jgi:hypothetical protein
MAAGSTGTYSAQQSMANPRVACAAKVGRKPGAGLLRSGGWLGSAPAPSAGPSPRRLLRPRRPGPGQAPRHRGSASTRGESGSTELPPARPVGSRCTGAWQPALRVPEVPAHAAAGHGCHGGHHADHGGTQRSQLTQEKHEEVVRRLTNGKSRFGSRSDVPFEGLLLHVPGRGKNGFRVVDPPQLAAALTEGLERLLAAHPARPRDRDRLRNAAVCSTMSRNPPGTSDHENTQLGRFGSMASWEKAGRTAVSPLTRSQV